jgi:Pathogenicity locus
MVKKMRNPGGAARAGLLEDLPNIGPSIAANLRLIGIERPAQLRRRNPYALYDRLNGVTGVRHDPCVLHTFISAVRFVDGEPARPWWKYTPERKKTLARVKARGGR